MPYSVYLKRGTRCSLRSGKGAAQGGTTRGQDRWGHLRGCLSVSSPRPQWFTPLARTERTAPEIPPRWHQLKSPEGRHPDGLQVWVRVPSCSCLSTAPGVPFVSICRPELKANYQPLPRTVMQCWDRHRVTTVDAPQKGGKREGVKESQVHSNSLIQPGKCWKALHWI